MNGIMKRFSILVVVAAATGRGINLPAAPVLFDGPFDELAFVAPEGFMLGEYQFGAVASAPQAEPGLSDGKGLMVMLEPGQGIRILGPVVNFGIGTAVIQCSVYTLSKDVVVAAAGLNAPEDGTLESIDGSLATNQPVNGAEFLNQWKALRVLYDPLGDAVVPVVQAVNPSSETVVLYLDRISVRPMTSLGAGEQESVLGIVSPTRTPYPIPPEGYEPARLQTPDFSLPSYIVPDYAHYIDEGDRIFICENSDVLIYNRNSHTKEFEKLNLQNAIVTAAVSSDRNRIYLGVPWIQKSPIIILDTNTGSLQYYFFEYVILSEKGLILDVSSDSLSLLAGDTFGTIVLFDTANGHLIRTLSPKAVNEDDFKNIIFLSFIQNDTKVLAVSQNGDVKVWDVQSGNLINRFTLDATVSSCTVSDDSQWLAAGLADGGVILYSLELNEIVRSLSGHTRQINACKFSSDGALLMTAGMDRTYRIWQVENGELIFASPVYSTDIQSLDYSPQRSTFLALVGTRLFDIDRTGRADRIILSIGHLGNTQTLSFGNAEKELYTVGEDNRYIAWDVSNGEYLREFSFDRSSLDCGLLFSPDGSKLAVQSASYTVMVYDTQSGESIAHLETPHVIDAPVAFSYDNEWLCCLYGNAYQIYETNSGNKIAEHTIEDDDYPITKIEDRMEFTGDRNFLIYVSRNKTSCYKIDTLTGMILEAHRSGGQYPTVTIVALATARTGEIVFTDRSSSGTLYRPGAPFWYNTVFFQVDHPNALAVSFDGKRVVSNGRSIAINETNTGSALFYIWENHIGASWIVQHKIVVAPSGNSVAFINNISSTSTKNRVYIYHLPDLDW